MGGITSISWKVLCVQVSKFDVDQAAVLRTMREVASGTMDEDTPLMEAGVDSLATTDVLNRLRALSGAPLPAALVFEQPTPRAIAAHVLGSLDAHDVSAELASPTSTLHSDAPLMVVQVPGLDGSGENGLPCACPHSLHVLTRVLPCVRPQ